VLFFIEWSLGERRRPRREQQSIRIMGNYGTGFQIVAKLSPVLAPTVAGSSV
jgi:hypothetical protein